MYTLNGIAIEDFGITASQIEGGNIAISGAWDMPTRIGKIYHDWGDEDGIEPYLREDEIFLSGRDIQFYGFMKVESREEYLDKIDRFYSQFKTKDLISFSSIDFGTWSVYLNSEVSIEYDYYNAFAQLRFTFREPVVEIAAVDFPAKDHGEYNIDGYSWSGLGITFLELHNDLNHPAPKDNNLTAYGYEGYSIGKRGFRELIIKAIVVQDDYTAFKRVLNRLSFLLSKPNSRILRFADGTQREVFVKDGFKVTNVNVEANQVIAELELKFAEIKELQNWNKLTDSTGLTLVDKYGQPLTEILKGF